MRQEPDFFEDRELFLVYMARKLRDALRLEDVLTQSGVNYCVETGLYEGGIIFRRELTGAFFYVDEPDLARARQVLIANRFKPYEEESGR